MSLGAALIEWILPNGKEAVFFLLSFFSGHRRMRLTSGSHANGWGIWSAPAKEMQRKRKIPRCEFEFLIDVVVVWSSLSRCRFHDNSQQLQSIASRRHPPGSCWQLEGGRAVGYRSSSNLSRGMVAALDAQHIIEQKLWRPCNENSTWPEMYKWWMQRITHTVALLCRCHDNGIIEQQQPFNIKEKRRKSNAERWPIQFDSLLRHQPDWAATYKSSGDLMPFLSQSKLIGFTTSLVLMTATAAWAEKRQITGVRLVGRKRDVALNLFFFFSPFDSGLSVHQLRRGQQATDQWRRVATDGQVGVAWAVRAAKSALL